VGHRFRGGGGQPASVRLCGVGTHASNAIARSINGDGESGRQHERRRPSSKAEKADCGVAYDILRGVCIRVDRCRPGLDLAGRNSAPRSSSTLALVAIGPGAPLRLWRCIVVENVTGTQARSIAGIGFLLTSCKSSAKPVRGCLIVEATRDFPFCFSAAWLRWFQAVCQIEPQSPVLRFPHVGPPKNKKEAIFGGARL
jgi:hypothetical protein